MKKPKIIRIATRQSPLALWQAEFVKQSMLDHFPELTIELVPMVTRGDKILDTPLAKIGGKGLFVKELEQGMLEGTADIAVHSMKDVPMELPDGFILPVIMQRETPFDAFVSNNYSSLDEIPENGKIGTSSLRRGLQLAERYPGFEILSLRGNVNTRLSKLDAGDYDAIILAAAGLKRLGFEPRIRQEIPPEQSLPAVGQGAVGIECLSGNDEVQEIIAALNHVDTSVCVIAERAMNHRLQGGCQVPIAGFATLNGDNIEMNGLVGEPDGSVICRASATGDRHDPESVGLAVAEDLLNQGAAEILNKLGLSV